MNRRVLESLDKHIEELRHILADVGTVAAIFKAITLIEMGPTRAREEYGLTSPYKQALFMLGQTLLNSEPPSARDLEDVEWQRVWKLLEEIFLAYAWMYFEKDAGYEGTHEQWLTDTAVTLPTFLNYFFSGDMTSVEQVRARIRDWLVPFDSTLEEESGISATSALDIANKISTDLQDTLDIVSAGQHAYHSLLERATREGRSAEELKSAALADRQIVALQNNLFNVYRIRLKTLVEDFDEKTAKAFWSSFLSVRGELEQFRYPTEENPIELAPLVQVEAGEARLPVGNILYTAILQSFSKRLLAGKIRETFLRARDRALENQVARAIVDFFPGTTSIYSNVFEQPDGQFEHDLIVVDDWRVLVVECKASPPREPFRDPRRAFIRIKDAFASDRGIQHGFHQANRMVSRLNKGESVTLFSAKGEEVAVLDEGQVQRVHAVVVTANNYGPIATDLSLLLHKDQHDEYPWVVNVYDLETFLDGLRHKGWGPPQLFRYLAERPPLNGKVFTVDELELAGVFLKHGTLRQFAEAEADRIALDPEMASVFDEIYVEKKGGPKAQLEAKTPLAFTDLRRALGLPGARSSTASPSGHRVGKVGRNAPCPCGSGKKFKKCCGRS